MLLAQVSDILSDLGFDAMTDITFAAVQALDAAEQQLAAAMDTEFEQGTFTDTFFVTEPRYRQGRVFQTEFRLNRAFVTSLTSIYANSSIDALYGTASPLGSWSNPVVGTPTPDTTPDLSAFVTLEAEKGVIRDIRNPYRNQYVQITYTAGFPVDPSLPNSYLISAVPTWLQQAAKIAAMIALSDSPSLTEADIKVDTKLLGLTLNSLLGRKMRYAPMSILPI
jgi:hypothetical protein